MSTVRPATPDDHHAALEVWRAAQAGRGRRPSSARLAEVAATLAEGLLVVADDVAPIGMAHGRAADGDLLEVTLVAVVPDRWRTGVGAELLEGLADLGWARGLRRITAPDPTDDLPARAFLEACGLELHDGSWTGELEAPVRDVAVFSDGIRLGQFLKLAELVETGAEAKTLLAEGGVTVNGEPEDRRGRQLVEGDLVAARDAAVRVHLPR